MKRPREGPSLLLQADSTYQCSDLLAFLSLWIVCRTHNEHLVISLESHCAIVGQSDESCCKWEIFAISGTKNFLNALP